jgi:putative thiamine transport system ATP-binding protein
MTLSLHNIEIALGGKPLIKCFSLDIASATVVTLMGPSGCGKSSLLSHISGDLVPPLSGSGRVVLNGVDVTTLPPARRRIGRLFQDDLLFPHLSVGENLLFGVPRAVPDRPARMRAALALAGLEGFENRTPDTLSGGQRARVALMRALLAEPSAMLLDEPFSKLDAGLRDSLRQLVFAHLKARQVPTLMVTHDIGDVPAGGVVYTISPEGEVTHV